MVPIKIWSAKVVNLLFCLGYAHRNSKQVPSQFLDMISRPEAVLCIDIGNSRSKACLFRNGQVVREENDFDPDQALMWTEQEDPYGIVIGNVAARSQPYMEVLAGHDRLVLASSGMPLPFRNLYRSETLGVDRLAAVCGALLDHDGRNCLILDAGTCLTYDLLDRDRNYRGGAIAPGLAMRLKAMHTFTARLPLLTPADSAPLAGLTTEECMMSGALNGLLLEAEGFYRRLSATYPGLEVVLTGGTAEMLKPQMPFPATHKARLVPEGLLLLFWWQQNLN